MTASGTADYTTVYDYNDADGNYTTLLQKEIKTVENEAETASASVLASNPADLLNTVSSGSETEETVYSYDANGNQITKTTSEKTETYTYDGLNQLIGFTDGDTAVSYAYNVSGLRIEKTVDGETINHVWDGSKQIVADIVDNDFYEADCYLRGTNLVAKYNYLNGAKSEYTYYTQNAHGDVVNLTDETGAVTKSYTYDAFGVEQNIDNSDTNAFRYCGEYFDAETGTVYLRARYYNPTIGRFISRDSYAGKNEDPLSLNLYTYCANNPIVFVDPSGHNAITKWFKDCWKNIKKKIETTEDNIKSTVKRYATSHRKKVECTQKKYSSSNLTISSTLSGSVTVIACNFDIGISLARDMRGNVGIQWSHNAGETLDLLGVSITSSQTITNANNIHELTGSGFASGGSVSVPVYGPLSAGIAVDHVSSPNGEIEGTAIGGTLGISRGISVGGIIGGEVHINTGDTQTIGYVNVYDLYHSLSDKVVKWANS